MEKILKKQPPTTSNLTIRQLERLDCSLFDAQIPTYIVKHSSSGVDIDIMTAGIEEGMSGSSINPFETIPANNLTLFKHDFTFGHLAHTTDRKFIEVFGVLENRADDADYQSPDMIIETESGHVHVVEFTTTMGDHNTAFIAALNKIAKYEIACLNRSATKPISLHVIAVHFNGVVTNLELTDEEVNEIVFRFRLARDIYEELREINPALFDSDETVSKLEREINSIMSSIKIDWEKTESKFPSFRKELFDHFRQTEVDEDYISKIISKCTSKALEEIQEENYHNEDISNAERNERNKSKTKARILNKIAEMMAVDFLRDIDDHKSTIQIPPWYTKEGPKGKDLNPLKSVNVSGGHPMALIWYKVATSAVLEKIDRMHDDPEAELQYALSGNLERSVERNKYHRTSIILNRDEQEYAATLGVCGKKNSHLTKVQDARTRSKKGFSIEHDISRIRQFLNDDSLKDFTVTDGLYAPIREDFDLRLQALATHQPGLVYSDAEIPETLMCHDKFSRTPIGSWLQMVSVIGAELSASVKQHVKPNQYIVKRLLNSGIYLLIKPTSSKGHIFVSIAVDKEYLEGELSSSAIFKTAIDAGGLLVTDFVSFKLSKITNLCKCFSVMEAAMAFWFEACGIEPWMMMDEMTTTQAREAISMFKLSLMTTLEDKATTEELQTMQRYIIMEGFVSLPELPNPSKMLSKLPKVLRSELQVFLVHCQFDSMMRISESPFGIVKSNGQIKWKNLFNPYTGQKVNDLQMLISCCYNGYFKNKEEETEPSALSAMYKKIIELEHLKPKTDEFLGYGDPLEPAMHEFSRSYLKLICQHAKAKLKKQYGKAVMTQIENSIIREVSHVTLERLATLKATSNFNKNWYVYKDVKDKNYTRDKLLVKMTEFANRGKTLAIEMFDESMTRVENKGCMEICLFKKQQHGGLREIYVMGADERIVQSIIEAISRAIGRYFDSDTLCNPSNKTRIPETHGQRAKRRCGRSVWTTATSDDARKWNQGHYVTKFALMLCEFTPREWWPLIIRGCSMFTNKFMMMNLDFLKIIDGHKELEIQDDFVTDLFKAYHGEKEVSWLDQGKTYLKTSTGMMQGILHFTSSMLHSLHQEFIKTTSNQIFTMKMGSEAASRVVCDMMQGSDDSSMIISFPNENEKQRLRYKLVAAICFRIKKSLGIYAGIYPSEKSTPNTDFVMEYNSEFFFHSQHIRPTIRWVAASCSLPEVETLVARQEEAANLLTSITEGGGSFSLAAMIQHSQCSIHYMLMGLGVSDLFKQFKVAISKWKDPGLGFFLFDNPYSAGLSGFKYNLYRTILDSNLKYVYSFFLKKVKGQGLARDDVISESCSVSPGGAIVMSSTLRWGSVEKFKRLRARLNIPEDWKDQINDVPEILYRAPATGKEIMLRIAEKVHSPGVVSSLSTGNAVCKVMASSVYFLSACIFEDAGNQEYKVTNDDKYSLLQKLIAFEKFNDGDDISQEDMLFLFPNLEEFEAFDSIIFNKGKFSVVPRASQREATQTRIVVFEHHSSARVAPEKLVSDKWFGTRKSKIGTPGFKQEWSRLKAIVRWLRDTPEETLEASPFTNHIQIRNFFARMEGKPRIIRVTGAPVKKRSGMSKIAMAIRDNFCKTGYLKGMEDEVGFSRAMQIEKIKHYLFSILMGPYTDEAKLRLTCEVLSKESQIVVNYNDVKSRANTISILQKFIKHETGVARLIEDLKAGIFGAFVKTQAFSTSVVNNKYYGPGVWRGIMDGYQVQIEINGKEGMPSYLSKITIAHCTKPWLISQCIKAWCEDMNVSNSTDLHSNRNSDANYWIFQHKMYGSSYPYGCPIYLVNSDITEIGLVYDNEIDIKVRRNTINLYVKSKDKRPRDLHILSYTPSDSDISSVSFKHIVKDEYFRDKGAFSVEPTRSWMLCQSLPWRYVPAVIDIACGERRCPTQINRCRLSEIIRLCTESSLRNKVGTIYSQSSPERLIDCEPIDMSEMLDMMMMDDENDMFEEIAGNLTVDEDPELTDLVDFEEEDLQLFGPAHYKEMQSLTILSHPMMDDFIIRMVSLMGRDRIRRLLEKNYVTSNFKDISIILFKALERDPNSIKEEMIHGDSPVDIADDLLG
ncbi:RNA polymerase [Gordil virus]|uniref:RNA-directed RNA polymerase L n=1 Tax=Gordil virus TaxID=1460451 RepID=W8JJ20_9VIRU|nr:RNA polymerase [Gordil virus]AHK60943.1 RNA polymerase [Gordil virus]